MVIIHAGSLHSVWLFGFQSSEYCNEDVLMLMSPFWLTEIAANENRPSKDPPTFKWMKSGRNKKPKPSGSLNSHTDFYRFVWFLFTTTRVNTNFHQSKKCFRFECSASDRATMPNLSLGRKRGQFWPQLPKKQLAIPVHQRKILVVSPLPFVGVTYYLSTSSTVVIS